MIELEIIRENYYSQDYEVEVELLEPTTSMTFNGLSCGELLSGDDDFDEWHSPSSKDAEILLLLSSGFISIWDSIVSLDSEGSLFSLRSTLASCKTLFIYAFPVSILITCKKNGNYYLNRLPYGFHQHDFFKTCMNPFMSASWFQQWSLFCQYYRQRKLCRKRSSILEDLARHMFRVKK